MLLSPTGDAWGQVLPFLWGIRPGVEGPGHMAAPASPKKRCTCCCRFYSLNTMQGTLPCQ